jgi:putative phosphoribosyl transferase
MKTRFTNRLAAGRELAPLLQKFGRGPEVIVLSVPRGGLLVGAELAAELGARLDALVVRRIASPADNQITLGAVAPWGVIARNESVIASLQLPEPEIAAAIRHEQELAEWQTTWYRGERRPPNLEDATVILVDDGMVSGATMEAAARAVRSRRVGRLIIAAPIASAAAVARLEGLAEDVVTLATVPVIYVLADHYGEFAVPDDLRLRRLLAERSTPALSDPPKIER